MCNSVYEGKVKSCEILCVDICIYKYTFDIENAHNRSLQNFHPGRACQGAEKGGLDFWMKGWGNLCRKTTAVYRFQNHGFLYVLFPIDQPIFISIDTSIKSYDVLPLISTIKLPFFVACRVHLSGFRGDEQPKGGTVFSGGSVVLPGQMSHRCNGNILGDEYHGDTGN